MKNPSLIFTIKNYYMEGRLTLDEYMRLKRKAVKYGVRATKMMGEPSQEDIKRAWKNDKALRYAFGNSIKLTERK